MHLLMSMRKPRNSPHVSAQSCTLENVTLPLTRVTSPKDSVPPSAVTSRTIHVSANVARPSLAYGDALSSMYCTSLRPSFLRHLCFSCSIEQYTSTAHDIPNVIEGKT